MEVKPGYKLTEVGVIPEEWEAIPLKGKVSISHGYAFASQYFAAHGPYRLATPGHFYEAGGFRDVGEKQKYYVGSVPHDYVLEPGDVIVAMTEQADGLLGSAAVIPNEFGYLHNQRLGRVRTLSPNIDLGYLVNVFNSPAYRAKVRETATGTKVKHTSPDKLLEIAVRLPPPPEQRAIAAALSDVDGLLGGLERLIAKKRDLKQAAMQQLLTGQTRLPGFHGEWEVKRLGSLLRFQVGFPFSSAFFNEKGEGIRLVKNRDLKSDDQIFHYNGKYEEAFVVRDGDVLIGMDGDFLPCRWNKGPALLNQRVGRVVPNDALNVTFAFYALIEPLKEIENVTSSTTVKHLSHGDVEGIERPLPEVPEQTAIAEVLSEMDGELAVLEQRREKTRALKQALMQELLTGRTRLL